MPARLSSMELSDPAVPDANVDAQQNDTTIGRRKSGRVSKKPEHFSTSQGALNNGVTKRKRDIRDEDDDEIGSDESSNGAGSSDGSEAEPDEEELKQARRKPLKKPRQAGVPASKKPKTTKNALTTTKGLPLRAGPKPKKSRAKARTDDSVIDGDFYSEVFDGAHHVDAITAEWMSRFEKDNVEAMRDLVNFVLKCTGCNLTVDVHDIGDPDNATGRLSDLQDEYQAQNITDYPLISKRKGSTHFKDKLINFIRSLIATTHASGILYTETALIENIQVWVTTMTSSAIRPFRHTATLVLLTIVSVLCDIAVEIASATADSRRQLETERKKARANKARLAEIEKKVEEGGNKREAIDGIIKDIFDTVFVHRYRDVDYRIRVDSVEALGYWISKYPDLFFEGQYLRYLGWVLSDTAHQTRAEVIRQLKELFKNKDNIGGLRTFTERFRVRLVEMATRDADGSVRAATVELLDYVREGGLLEPDDIDTVGQLIFDADPRVRKAVVNFFVATIDDLYESKIDDLGGDEALEEALPKDADGDYEIPRIEWIKLKCLVEALILYDSQDREDLPTRVQRGTAASSDILIAAGVDSRLSLAAQTVCERIPEVREWETLAGYLLFDHSATSSNVSADDPEGLLKKECKLDETEEIALLELLNSAVRLQLTEAVKAETDKKGKRSKARAEESRDIQETAARHLANLIPQLLQKFGAVPAAASAVLRLEHLLNLNVFEELRQDTTTYSRLLDDINRQFLTHADSNVLTEASAALLHAMTFEELQDVTDEKVQSLWDDTLQTLTTLLKGKDICSRGSLSLNAITGLSNTIRRLSNLAGICNCTDAFETVASSSGKGRANVSTQSRAPFQVLIDLLDRAVPTQMQIDSGIESLEDSLVSSTQSCLLRYFMWQILSLKSSDLSSKVDTLEEKREALVDKLTTICHGLSPSHPLRITSMITLLELFTALATLRRAPTNYQKLIHEIPKPVQALIVTTFAALEKSYAKKVHKTLDAADDDEPFDSTPEPDDDEDEEADESKSTLMLESTLCDFTGRVVFAILARVADVEGEKDGLKERIRRNQQKLGQYFRAVVSHLDDPRTKSVKGVKRTKKLADQGRPGKSDLAEAEDDEGNDPEEQNDDEDPETLRARELLVDDNDEDEVVRTESPEQVDDEIMGD